MKKLSLFVIIIGTLAALFGTVQGATSIYSLNIIDGRFLQCVDNVIEAEFTPAAIDTSGATMPTFQAEQHFVLSNGATDMQTDVLTSYQSRRFYLALGSSDVTYADVYLVSTNNPTVRSSTYRIYCDSTVISLGGGINADGVLGIDDRFNRTEGDLVNVLYRRNDPTGNSGVAVYSLDEDFDGVFEGFFTYEMFEPYLDNAPEENVMLGQVDRSTLYALTSGQFQIVIHDPYEVKIYEVVFDAFPINNVIFR